MEKVLIFEYSKEGTFIYPTHPLVKNWRFKEDQEAEANLCNSMAVLAEKNGINQSDLMHLFPATLRMLKCGGEWAQ